jgi:hypothetical protein
VEISQCSEPLTDPHQSVMLGAFWLGEAACKPVF